MQKEYCFQRDLGSKEYMWEELILVSAQQNQNVLKFLLVEKCENTWRLKQVSSNISAICLCTFLGIN